MLSTVVRKEHKNRWERRTALIPAHMAELKQQGLPIDVEPSEIRIFSDDEYRQVGCTASSNPDMAQFVVGIKEPPVESIQPGQVHMAFSHTIKGQDYNMPLLQKFIDQKATLIDYEPIVDEHGQRTIAFGRYAGIAGAIDSFHVAGRKWGLLGKDSPLKQVMQTWQYEDIEHIKSAFANIDVQAGEPVQVLIVGSGKVGRGAREVCEWIGLPEIDVESLINGESPEGSWFAVASSRHIHRHKNGQPFDMTEFVEHGKSLYESTFDQLLGKFNILLQTPYWTDDYPKHLDRQRMLENRDKLPLVIGDISCDINGSLECTKKASDIDHPAFSYYVDTDSIKEGIYADGITVMSIDNLPCELAKDASTDFSAVLKAYMPELMSIDLNQDFKNCGLGKMLSNAVIVYKGELTPNFKYLQNYLDNYFKS